MLNFRAGLMLEGAGGPVALQTSPPVRRTKSVDTDPHAALRALLVGLRPPTPQSPEGLRSTPFDCVAIAPCCFAFRKAVLSHALAALSLTVREPSRADMLCGTDRLSIRDDSNRLIRVGGSFFRLFYDLLLTTATKQDIIKQTKQLRKQFRKQFLWFSEPPTSEILPVG